MEKPLRIALDTCTFIGMVQYNEVWNIAGKIGVHMALKRDEQDLEKFQKIIYALMSPEYMSAFQAKHPEEDISKPSTFKKAMEEYIDYASNIKKKPSAMSQEEYDWLVQNKPVLSDFKELRAKYLSLYNYTMAGQLFSLYLDDKVEFCITNTVFDEIIIPLSNPDVDIYGEKAVNGNIVRFSVDKMLRMLQNCTYLHFEGHELQEEITKLSREYRTSLNDKNIQPMAQDTNSIGIFGDSRIMAEACLAGLVLVTANTKDFIYDKSRKGENERIRKHIAKVNALKGQDLTTDALPYTVEEFVTGQFELPKIPSQLEVFKTSKTNVNISTNDSTINTARLSEIDRVLPPEEHILENSL